MKQKLLLGLVIVILVLNACGMQTKEKDSHETENVETMETEEIEASEEVEETQTEEIIEVEPEPEPEPEDSDLVLVKEYIPDIVIDLKYATTDNFTGQIIYENADAYLRYGTVK